MKYVLVVQVRSINSAMVNSVKPLQVVAAIICNDVGRILIAKRQSHQTHPGYWELPGGKLEPNETHAQALYRELLEEIGIKVQQAERYWSHQHDYDKKSVHLTVYWVQQYQGEAVGAEGQEVRWVNRADLSQYAFPAANQVLIEKLILV
jgi:8-oxo-dGTP diphosphatase